MEWISILQCPISGERLRQMHDTELVTQEMAIAAGKLWHISGTAVARKIGSCLVTISGKYRYPVDDGIVLILPGFALVDSPDLFSTRQLHDDKQWVKDFYDQSGWFANADGNYKDAVIYEDLRDVSKNYIKKCHDRVGRFLPASGTYLLDAASGPIQHVDYLQYAEHFRYRVCVDFSFQALREAKRKLGDRAICILCDITQLPFVSGTLDGFVSLNTIYHIPADEQVTAIKELYRVLMPGGKGVVVYDWYKHSSWMNVALFPFRTFVFLKNRFLDALGRAAGKKGADRRLYFFAHPPAFFRRHLPPYQLRVWRTVSVPFMRYYVHAWLFGRQFLAWLYRKEEEHPGTCGLKGEYPMMVFEKNDEPAP